MGFNIENHTCITHTEQVCFFRLVNGSVLAVIALLGILFSSFTIYFLALRRIKLANCKNLLIINVAVSDVAISTLGFFRGLGIINSKYVGVVNNSTTPGCVVYALSMNSYANSGMLALLPLTIDRAVAIILPLKYKCIITRRACLGMFAGTWSSILIFLLYDILAYTSTFQTVEYSERYHRCVVVGEYSYIEELCLISIPFLLILLMYSFMLCVVVSKRRQCGRFLITASGIILTSLVAYSPTVIADTWDISLRYEVSQILTVTVFYTGGVVNPLIYVLSHPVTQRYVNNLRRKKTGAAAFQSSVYPTEFEASRVRNNSVVQAPRADIVRLPDIKS
ncbi:hypothetical protein ACHWQZ_G005140 [Mnemiopsis leidyi]